MMYEELVKKLRRCGKGLCTEDCPDWTKENLYHTCQDEAVLEAADAIEELIRVAEVNAKRALKWASDAEKAEKAQRWIPVTEPPKKDGWYQVYAPSYSGGSSSGLKNINGNMYSAFKHGKWSIEVGYHKRPGCVKAWMPLPEPPKEEA